MGTLDSNFTMSVDSLIFCRFLIAYLLLYHFMVISRIRALWISTKAEITPKQRTLATVPDKFRMLLIFHFQYMLRFCLCIFTFYHLSSVTIYVRFLQRVILCSINNFILIKKKQNKSTATITEVIWGHAWYCPLDFFVNSFSYNGVV